MAVDLYVKQFTMSKSGVQAMAAWIAARKAANEATAVLTTVDYTVNGVAHEIVVMATTTQAGGGTLGSVAAAQFNLSRGVSALVTWMNAQYSLSPSKKYLQSFRVSVRNGIPMVAVVMST
jgi:uncharacterized BrkB/YihY/UPF0761 family membrane protein